MMTARLFIIKCIMTAVFLIANPQTIPVPAQEVVLGDEQFDEYLPLLDGKRIALFSNHTGIVGDENSGLGEIGDADPTLIPFGTNAAGEEITYGRHILDALLEKDVDITAVFSPEHGFRGTGDAGAGVENSVDEKTGVPILSLYSGSSRYPAQEDLDRFDTLVVDIQDVGLRYYTYYISMYYLMDACAANDKEVIILDRPNPNGFYVDGPILKDEFKSGVGILPIPVVHGMTLGELAQMINGEGWLEADTNACDLKVIPCRNYNYRVKTSLIRRPSPNLKDMRAVYLYASTCFFENTAVSVGRGTEFPFEIYGSPYLNEDTFKPTEGTAPFTFIPQSMIGAQNPPFEGEECTGADLREIPIEEIWDSGINLSYLIDAYDAVKKATPEVGFWGKPTGGQYWIDTLSGSSELRTMIEEGKTAKEIKASWQEELAAFIEQRRPYLLYEE
ncbi:MAG: DUF1343 domain-containing protein [Lachnospiraceae bacterium]|nr:DUF1343 domain-containing protein [Lachnospiraceae bacterium]